MHILSHTNRQEFLATPQLVRVCYAKDEDGRIKPTLLVKADSLLLKYILLGSAIRMTFTKFHDQILYALRVDDDQEAPAILWSFVATVSELDAARTMLSDKTVPIYLFNEVAVNIGSCEMIIAGDTNAMRSILGMEFVSDKTPALTEELRVVLDELALAKSKNQRWELLHLHRTSDWNLYRNTYITEGGTANIIDMDDTNEGGQQENLGVWLTDRLQPQGVYHSPQRPYRDRETRELTDLLLTHQYGTILVESKTLSVFARKNLPPRSKLKRDLTGIIRKGFGQLEGAVRTLKSDAVITSTDGKPLEIEREPPAHAVMLIPDIHLVEDRGLYNGTFIRGFIDRTNSFPHILDVSELLRIVQAAEIISNRSNSVTKIMAFDYYLIERVKKAISADSLCIEVILRIGD